MLPMHRLEGFAKLTGAERYLDDEPIPGCLWGMTVRSPVSRGRITAVKFDSAIDWSSFIVADHRDIPGPNETYMIENDQPVLAAGCVRHVHEPVVLIAHEDRRLLRRAVAGVKVEVDPEPPVLDYRVPPRAEQVQRGADNTIKSLRIAKGDVERALAEAAHVIEGEYQTGAQEHIYIEPNAMAAWVEGDVVVVRGSMQCPYYVLNALKHALGRDERRVRVIQAPTGGGFGGKEDYPSTLALHAALLSLKAGGRPVKIVYDRDEDMAATTKRHPSRVRHTTGVDADGRLTAMKIDVLLDGGAYVTLSPVVLSRGIIHACGPYFCPNVLVEGRAVMSNSVPYGAFRGFGAPQTQFACERHMDRVAGAIGMDPVAFRKLNLLRDGQATATGQTIGGISGGTDRVAILDQALKLGAWDKRRREAGEFNLAHPYLRRGVGVSCVWHGAGFTGNGEVYLDSKVQVAGLADGRIEVRAASTEMGQGTSTVFTQIAAAAAGYSPGQIVVATPDTAVVPNSGPTVASRTVMVVGRLIEKACGELKEILGTRSSGLGVGGLSGESLRRAIVEWHARNPGRDLAATATFEPPPGVKFDDERYVGDAYATYAWGACVAHVEIDLRTCAARVLDFASVQDIGRVINPVLAKGQVQGGVVQAIGWTLLEECRFRDGAMVNNQLTNYIIPTADDVPPIEVEFVEVPYAHGGGGAKGVGELPMDGPAPAIINAIADATGADPVMIPMTPERLMMLVETAEGVHGV